VRGWDPVKKESILLHAKDSPTLPDIRFDDMPTICGKLGRATPCGQDAPILDGPWTETPGSSNGRLT
jgi:hypothetical protein